jgi:hypothetical protein
VYQTENQEVVDEERMQLARRQGSRHMLQNHNFNTLLILYFDVYKRSSELCSEAGIRMVQKSWSTVVLIDI